MMAGMSEVGVTMMMSVDLGPFMAKVQKVFDSIRTAFESVSRATGAFVRAMQRSQRRMRRKAARAEGRRHARSVGPWGLPWALIEQHREAPLDAMVTAGEAAAS